jgi:hypothetical protein
MKLSIATTKLCLLSVAVFWAATSTAATRFDDPSKQPLGAIAPLVLSDTDLSSGTVKAYRPWFETGAWQGDLVEYSIGAIGTITTSVDFTGTSPVNTGTPPENWSALFTMAAAADADPNYWRDGRKIITSVGTANTQKSFTWNMLEPNKGIGADNMELIDKIAFDAGDASSAILNYIRGDQSNEYPEVLALRPRASALGDIIHSNPTYVGAPIGLRTDNNYATWVAEAGKFDREPRIYVGSNDGMLHVFDADDGSEVYAYIPSMLMGNLKSLSARPFTHRYFVDGKLTAKDAFFAKGGSGTATWHTVLVGALGAGGRGVFALDITNPDLSNEDAVSGTDIKVLWEIDASADDNLGDSFSRASIVQLNDDAWYAVFGNGYNSVNGEAMLYLVNIGTGAVTRVSTSSGSAGSPNGLSSPTLLDTNKDGKADYAYAGDIDGNLWKFDLTTPGSLTVVSGPLHPAQTLGAKPITAAPRIVLHPNSGYIVYFGTGRLFTAADLNDSTVQSMYGIWDSGLTPPTKATQSLLQVTLDAFNTYTSGDNINQIGAYNPDAGDVNWAINHGWQVDFPAGYRVLEAIQVRGARAKVTAHNPNNGQRKNALIEASIYDGGAHKVPIFDLSGDGILDTTDLYDGNGDSDILDSEDIPMAWQRQDGIMSQVSIARVTNGIDTLFLNYLEPPLPCTDCGFVGGHIDVDTWSDGEIYGGYSTRHHHEYDKWTGRVIVDLFDLNIKRSRGDVPPRRTVYGQVEINDTPVSGIAEDEEFVVLISNADFSAGSTFKIGEKTWNVADYQRQLHLALIAWDARVDGSVPKVQEGQYIGQSLSFNWGDVSAEAGGTGSISHNFDTTAIISGGLHPTQTACVRDSAFDTFNPSTLAGRWRNGALTTQLVKTSHFSSASAIDDVHVQQPDDLVRQLSTSTGGVYLFANDDNGDEYEMGGIIAKTDVEHIWESALFWHFGKLNQIVNGGKPCYGDDGWNTAVILESIGNPFANALEQLGDDLEGIDINNLEQEVADRSACSDKKASDSSSCKSLYKLLVNLIRLRPDYDTDIPPANGYDDQDLGVGTVTPGAASNEGPTAGVGFNYGRASWIDVAPK